MISLDLLSLSFILVGTGLALFVAVRLLLIPLRRMAKELQPGGANPQAAETHPSSDLPQDVEAAGQPTSAVVIIQAGGRAVSINASGRAMFRLAEGDQPELERILRRIRPAEDFLRLCSHSGEARFVLDGRPVDGTSFSFTLNNRRFMALTLRYPESSAELSTGQGRFASRTLQTFNELTQAMAASLDLNDTLQGILQSVEKLIPADTMEIALWDDENSFLVPYRMIGHAGDRSLELSKDRYYPLEGYSGYLYTTRSPLLIPNVNTYKEVQPAVDRRMLPIQSYIGVPLMVKQEFIGTLELGSFNRDAFQANDLDVLQMLSGQAAIAIHNAMLYRAERARSIELAGLSQLAQAFGSLRDPKNLFQRLVESIGGLVRLQVLGFLLYNSNQRTLVAQAPFQGLPSQFIPLYHIPVPQGGKLEQKMLEQDVLITENASEDPLWHAMGFEHLTQAASLRDTILIPLTSGGRFLGYLQASNHLEGGATFTKDELHLLMIISNQAATIIENANLLQQTRQRAQRADTLRRVVALASSAASLDEILKLALQELAALIEADLASVFLFNQVDGSLELHTYSLFGSVNTLYGRSGRLLSEDPQFPMTVTGSGRAWVSNRVITDPPAVPFYQGILSTWKMESVAVVPLVVREQGIGEIWFGSLQTDFFEQGIVQTLSTAAGYLAGVVEQSFLRAQTNKSLRRRVEQLTAITRINRELGASLDLQYLLQLVYDEAIHTTHADSGSIQLFDLSRPTDSTPVVRYQVGKLTSSEGISLLERVVLDQNEPLLVQDFQQAVFAAPSPEIRSGLLVPISYQNRHAGIISLYAEDAHRFDQTAVEILQSLAVQASVALGNAMQYEEQTRRGVLLSREVETLAELLKVSQAIQPDLPLENILNVIAVAIQKATPFQVVLISVVGSDGDTLQRVIGAGLPPEAWQELHTHTQSFKAVESLLLPEFQIGSCYYIPADKSPVIPAEVHTLTVLPLTECSSPETWDPDDILLVPLRTAEGKNLGLISLDAPSDRNRPDRPTFDALELFGTQASMMIENHQRVSSLETQVSALQAEQERLKRAVIQAQKNLPVFLRKDLEQSIAIQGLMRQSERFHATLEIAETANRQSNEAAMLQTLGRELLIRFNLQAVLIAERTPTEMRLAHVLGNVPPGVNPESLFGQRNPLRQLLIDGEILLIADLAQAPDWQNNPMLSAFGACSLIGLPLGIEQERGAGVLALSQRPMLPFTEDDHWVFAQLVRQVSVSLQDLQLLAEIWRRLREMDLLLNFTRKIGSLEPENILNSLVESVAEVLPAAQATWAALWQESRSALVIQAATGYPDPAAMRDLQYVLENPPGSEYSLPGRVFRFGIPERTAEVHFAEDYQLSGSDLMRYRKATNGRLPVSALALPIQLGEVILGVLGLENFDTSAAFAQEDETLALSFAQQAALALENARLYQAVQQRAAQSQALTQVAGTLTSSLRSDELIHLLLDSLRSVIAYDTATLWLRQGNRLVVASANGFAGNEGRIGLAIEVSDSILFNEMNLTGQPIIVNDVRRDPRFPSLVPLENLSWLGIPLVAKSVLIGAIALEKREPGFYTPDMVQAATTFAAQAAVSIDNARLFEESMQRSSELNERSQRLALLNRLSSDLAVSMDLDFILQVAAQHFSNALGEPQSGGKVSVASVLITELKTSQGDLPGDTSSEFTYTWRSEVPLRSDVPPRRLPNLSIFNHLAESLGVFSAADITTEPEMQPLVEQRFLSRQVKSVLIVPLLTVPHLHGWLVLQTTEPRRFNVQEIDLARTICNQSAIAMQNARLFEQTRRLTQELEQRVEERTSELRREHHNTQTLLHISTELSTSLETSTVINRALAVLNEAVGSQESMILLTQEGATPYRAGMELVAPLQRENGSAQLEQEMARWIIRLHRAATIEDVAQDGRWNLPPGALPGYHSVMGVPLLLGEEALGTLLLFHQEPAFFKSEQVTLVEAAARQISVALNNAQLFNLIREQSEQLATMLRLQQVESSRSRAILEAVADGIVVTDSANRITLINASAERILRLQTEHTLGQSLEQFSGLFGKAAGLWMQTIRKWSQDPLSFLQPGETYSVQLELDNERVVSVHLAPVFLHAEFLGTVSIFRDITHEVQVDRLKSEFVANVSHELRTPMTSIKGFVEIMLMGAAGELNPQQSKFLQTIKSNTDRLSVLVNDLLDVSRIDAGRVTLSIQPVNLLRVVEEVVAEVQRRSQQEQKPMAVSVDIPASLPAVQGDQERVRQIIANLVSNAYLYTPAGGMIQVTARLLPGEVQVDVTDNGIGIPLPDQRRIFERFYRGDDPLVLASAGNGLGLSIVKTLVEMHQGRIWFYSSGVRGEGSTFSFTLPLYDTKG
ncbi:MAG TPA: GAF domain-containing protein [Anaerolineaceae bacterium]